jgi:ATP synthase protein I
LITAGVLVWGGVGWLVAEWLDNRIFVMLGLLLGMGGGLYLVWLRYGSD